MALVFTPLDVPYPNGKYHARIFNCNFDTTYAAGGKDVVAPAQKVGINSVKFIRILDGCTSTGHVIRYDRVNKKLMAFVSDNPNAAAGPLIQNVVADLSAANITVEILY